MDYSSIHSDSLTYGERPLAGWDYVLSFTTPPPDTLLERLQHAGFHYSALVLPTRTHLRLALPHETMSEKAEALSLRLRLLPQYGGGFLPYTADRAHVFTNSHHAPRPYFNPSQRVSITLAVLKSRDEWGAGINVRKMIRDDLIHAAFVPHAEPERTQLLQALGRRWWSPFRPTPLAALRAYFGSTVTRYIAWLVFYTRMLIGIAALSIPVYILIVNTHSQRALDILHLSFGLSVCFWCAYWCEYWKRRNAVLNVKWGLVDFYEDNENDLQPDFRGVPQHGFYCRGGFVDLSDLSDSHTSTFRRRLERVESSSTLGEEPEESDVVLVGGGGDRDFTLEAPVTGLAFGDLPVLPFSSREVLKNRIWISVFVTAFFAAVVAVLSFLILFYKQHIIALFRVYRFGNSVPGIATAFLISVSDSLWKRASVRLTTWENHRTKQSYSNSLIRKRFAFQFVSNYISLFYIAFVKPFTTSDPCIIDAISGGPNCMLELRSQLTSLVITKATIQQVLEVGIPFVTFRVKHWFLQHRTEHLPETSQLLGDMIDDDDARRIIEESKMTPYPSTMQDYGELVIQVGYLVMFGLAFPLAAAINLFNNIVESRTDVYKMLAVHQRPEASDSADIGGWREVISIISTASVMTTAGLVTITSPALQRVLPDFIGDIAEKYPAVSFLIFEHLLLGIRWGVGFLVTDTPASTFRMLARQEFVMAKCFDVGWKPYFHSNVADDVAEKPLA